MSRIVNAINEIRFVKIKSSAPCPRCGGNNTYIENDIFVCYDCGFEG